VKAVSSTPALILNIVDRAYVYKSPDHWRLPPDTEQIPFKLI
jgi:dTDP-4-dehydrorhamnose 3,5-epimerase